MYGLKRMLEIKAEKERKKAEKEAKKKEKEEEKLRLKREAHKKKLKKKANQRFYQKRRKKELAEREKIGDEYAFYSIYLTRNRKRYKWIGASWWKTDAYKIFNKAIEENRAEVSFPLKIVETSNNKIKKMKYEIVIVKKVKEDDDKISQFKNEDGKYIDNIIIDKNSHIIEAKHEWLIEETFYVYGYHPRRDRKTYKFILNDLLLNNITHTKEDTRSITTFQNKVFIDYIGDFDFILCKTPEEAQRLYTKLEHDIPNKDKKYIFFLGEINKNRINSQVQRMMEKTGWKEAACKKSSY